MHDKDRFYSLDAIRGVAALFVLAFHYAQQNHLISFPGYLAVDLFFALSGFVIAMNYSRQMRTGLGVLAFMRLRIERLYPLWFMGGMIALLHMVLRGDALHMPRWLAGVAFANLLILPAPSRGSLFPLNLPGWSLFFELVVNLLFAAGLWRMGTRSLCGIMVVAGLALAWFAGPPSFVDQGATWPTFFGGFPRALFSFVAGVLIFETSDRNKNKGALRRATWLALIPVVVAAVAIAWAPTGIWQGTTELARVFVLFPLIVWLAIQWEFPAVLKGPAQWLGDLSYPVYVIHVPLMFLGDHARDMTGSASLGLALYGAAVVAIAIPAVWIDRAARRWLRKMRTWPGSNTKTQNFPA